MRRLFVFAFVVLALCFPFATQAKVEHLLPKVHSLTRTNSAPFVLHRDVAI